MWKRRRRVVLSESPERVVEQLPSSQPAAASHSTHHPSASAHVKSKEGRKRLKSAFASEKDSKTAADQKAQDIVPAPPKRGRGRPPKPREESSITAHKEVAMRRRKSKGKPRHHTEKYLIVKMTRKLPKVHQKIRFPRSAAAKALIRQLSSDRTKLTQSQFSDRSVGYGKSTRERYEEEDVARLIKCVRESMNGDERLLGGSGNPDEWSPGPVARELAGQAGRLARRIREQLPREKWDKGLTFLKKTYAKRIVAELNAENVGVPKDFLAASRAAEARIGVTGLSIGDRVKIKKTGHVTNITDEYAALKLCKVSGDRRWYRKDELEKVDDREPAAPAARASA